MIYLEDIKTESDAIDAVAELEIAAIEASESISNKRNKIARAECDIKMVSKLCLLRKWITPQNALNNMLDRLAEARAELQVNLWRS